MSGPLIVQSDRTVLLEVAHPQAEDARHELAVFAELERAPEHVHTYRITRLGLWNARAAGHTAEQMLETLERFAKFPVPQTVTIDIEETVRRYGRLVIERDAEGELILTTTDPAVLAEITRSSKFGPLLGVRRTSTEWTLQPWARGQVKQELLKLGWPAEDHAGYTPGTPHEIDLIEDGWAMRGYQRKAVENFFDGGSGVVVLPCGAGKTIVGAGAMAEADATTLILVTNTVSARQWRAELLKRTTLTEDEIGEYSGERKEIKPVTIATYQILTAKRKGEFAHLALLDALDWGLIVYDEVHLLPAPVFKLTAELQARRRLGLTATLVRWHRGLGSGNPPADIGCVLRGPAAGAARSPVHRPVRVLPRAGVPHRRTPDRGLVQRAERRAGVGGVAEDAPHRDAHRRCPPHARRHRLVGALPRTRALARGRAGPDMAPGRRCAHALAPRRRLRCRHSGSGPARCG